ncbi:MAG TPA: hypothetical protein VLY63_16630, partial [Anaerolineae bacterium]|nr:hypothetical protein [Anaerolineae bacterium]
MPVLVSISILAGTLLSLLLAPACIRLASRVGMIDNPAGVPHKIHAAPMPRAGGLVLLTAALLVGAATGILWNEAIATILLASLPVFAVGVWDDTKGIGALPKVSGQLLGGLILIQGGVATQFLHNPALDYPLTLFWVIGITN